MTEKKTNVHTTIIDPPTANNCKTEGSIVLASARAEEYMNLYVKGSSLGYVCASPVTMRALRDKLNEVYPVEPVAIAAQAKSRKAPRGAQAYRGNGEHAWEQVTDDCQRLRVPGGWLYSDESHMSLAFVPVPSVVGYAV